MANELIKIDLTRQQKAAIEVVATNPGISNKGIARQLEMDENTIGYWMRNPTFAEACFDRFTELAGTKLIVVMDSMFREAGEGNVAAARLILEHHNKLQKNIHITIDSPFDKFLNSSKMDVNNIDAEDAEIIGDAVEITSDLPERNEKNNFPTAVDDNDKQRVKNIPNVSHKLYKVRKQTNSSYHLRQRALAVGLSPLPPHRPSVAVKNAWIKQLKRLERQNGIKYED